MVTLEAILERNNLNRAYKQVKANKGGPGVDGMTVDDLLDYLRTYAVEIVESVKAGKYTRNSYPISDLETDVSFSA